MIRSTTIICVRRGGETAIAGDGQVTTDSSIVKTTAKKVRKLFNDKVLAGFAGSAADAFTLFEKFEAKLKKNEGNLMRAVVDLAREWRSDRFLRRLEALMMVADSDKIFLLSGTGDVIEPDTETNGAIMAIGSGAQAARGAALALLRETDLDAGSIAESAMSIASEICIYTNESILLEKLED